MRMTAIRCSDLSAPDLRLDPSFYRRRGEIHHLLKGDTRNPFWSKELLRKGFEISLHGCAGHCPPETFSFVPREPGNRLHTSTNPYLTRGVPILGSATFTALRFSETPCYFAISLSHPLVRTQLDLLAVGSVQRFVNKRDLDDLLVPRLATLWREDFNSRMERALQLRREALAAHAQMFVILEAFIRERWRT